MEMQELAEAFHALLNTRARHAPSKTVLCSEAEAELHRRKDGVRDTGVEGDPRSVIEPHDGGSAAPGFDAHPSSRPSPLEPPPDAREEARRAARRLVNFGWESQGVKEERPVEAVQDGQIVEASFAKGEWGIRWRPT